MRMLKDKRLLALAELVEACDTVADIGADHGYLGCHLLECGKAGQVWFTDISAKSLDKARELARRLELSGRCAFFVCDGAEGLPDAPDFAVVAGMGGQTIRHILECGAQKLKGSALVLGANTGLIELRAFLALHGYRIDEEVVQTEAGRHYVLMRARPGKAEYSPEQLLAGPVLMKRRSAADREYFAYRLLVARRALEEAQKSSGDAAQKLQWEVEVWKSLC